MSNQKIFATAFLLTSVFVCSANATPVWVNNASAIDINMLSEQIMSFTHNSDSLSDFFKRINEYGTMNRLNEYGGDGFDNSAILASHSQKGQLLKGVWIDAKHINANVHYSNHKSARTRYNLFGFGTTTKDLNLKYGDLSFGAFVAGISGNTAGTDTYGNSLGIFTKYNYKQFDAGLMLNNGSVNNKQEHINFNNAWFNVAMDAHVKFKIDNTLYFQPGIYAGYTWVSSDNLYIGGQTITSKNSMFLNVAPSARFVKHIIDDWYGAMSVKYVATFNRAHDIYINNIAMDGISVDDYTEISTDVEYNYKNFTFAGAIQKQIGGFDGWAGNIKAKYLF